MTIYAVILAFFFLPADALSQNPLAQTLLIATSATYVIKESEILPIYKLRKKIAIENKAVSQLTNLNPNIFCVDLALELMDLSSQTYYDPEHCKTVSSSGSIDLKLDYDLKYSFYDVEHETICYIFKHRTLKKLVVSFRGTSSKQHWNDNLNFGLNFVNIHSMPISDSDLMDELDTTEVDTGISKLESDHRESVIEPLDRSLENKNSNALFRSEFDRLMPSFSDFC